MIKGKKQILLLSILGVTTLLVAIIGATYAYFTTSMTGRNGTINTTTAKIGAASFTAESVSVDKVLPGWTSGEKNVTVTLEPSDYDVKYTCTLKMTANPLTDLTLTVQGTNALTSVNGKLKSGASDTIIASGTLKASQTKQSVSMTYTLSFPETGVDQNTQQGKTITGLVTCSTEGQTVYYNSENPNGTTTKPTGTDSISLQEAILRDNPTISERTNFSTAFTDETTGTIFQTDKTEDGSTVYYYAGDTTNNWVKFGYYNFDNYSADKNAKDYFKKRDYMYWRIIRTNEDGSIRLIYAGNNPDSSNPYIPGYQEIDNSISIVDNEAYYFGYYNEVDEDPIYVGYMYGTSGSLENNRTNENSSTIKKSIDIWYYSSMYAPIKYDPNNNQQNNKTYNDFVSKSAIYCNDRSIGEFLDAGTTDMYNFGSYTRISNYAPTYKCGGNGNGGLFESTQAVADKFSASTEGGGNGQLKCFGNEASDCPVALMTADETVFAGVEPELNASSNIYLNNKKSGLIGTHFWTMTPSYSYGGDDNRLISIILNGLAEQFYNETPAGGLGIRPVLSLKSCVKVTGTGTPYDPYIVDYDNSCN